jgi:hypothetical protein
MADVGDLKSSGLNTRAGSTPASGTNRKTGASRACSHLFCCHGPSVSKASVTNRRHATTRSRLRLPAWPRQGAGCCRLLTARLEWL